MKSLCRAYHVIFWLISSEKSCSVLSCAIWTQVMVSRPRSDLNINLPALRKLDSMLLVSLTLYSFFPWYPHPYTMTPDISLLSFFYYYYFPKSQLGHQGWMWQWGYTVSLLLGMIFNPKEQQFPLAIFVQFRVAGYDYEPRRQMWKVGNEDKPLPE